MGPVVQEAVFGDIFGLVPDAMNWGFIINVVQCTLYQVQR